jgi:hypothetical protein
MGFGNGSVKAAKVAHAWANKIKPEMYERGRETRYRIYFEGDTIYSYGSHFPIACLHEKDGATSVLFTNRKNSKTTSGHIRLTWDACSQYDRILCNDPVDAKRGYHDHNLSDWDSDARNAANELATARNKEARYNTILNAYGQAKIYADYFGLTLSVKDYPSLFVRASKEFEAQIKAAHLAQLAQIKKDNEKKIAVYNEHLGYWRKRQTISRDGISIDFTDRYQGADPMGYSYFRYNPISERIETTQRIEIPLTAAKRFLTEICPAICSGSIVRGTKILDYTLLEANADYIRVGCHKISTEEIKRQALEMGWEVC